MNLRQGNLLELAETLYPSFNDLLWTMERRGVPVSFDELRRIQAEADADKLRFAKELDSYAGCLPDGAAVNWNANTTDVAWFLYDKLGLPELPDDARSPKFWNKTRITANEAIEWWHRHFPERRPELDALRRYRRACRAWNYAADLEARAVPDGRWRHIGWVHPTYGTYNDASRGRDKTGTSTGRLSISNPPLQQIPRDKKKDPYRVRRAFVAPPGKRLVVVDLEQLEVRIQAHIHQVLFGDDTLTRLCEAGDFHGDIAIDVFSQVWPDYRTPDGLSLSDIKGNEVKEHTDPFVRWCRDQIKAVFYGRSYRKGVRSFAATLWTLGGDPVGETVAQAIFDGMDRKIPSMARFASWVDEQVEKQGGMWSLLGRWRPVEKTNRGKRQATNQPMQAGGAELAMLWMLKLRGLDVTLQVHDEVHVLADEGAADVVVEKVVGAAESVGVEMGLRCPIKASGGHADNWDECK